MTQRRIGLALLAAGNVLVVGGFWILGSPSGEIMAWAGVSMVLWGFACFLPTLPDPRDR